MWEAATVDRRKHRDMRFGEERLDLFVTHRQLRARHARSLVPPRSRLESMVMRLGLVLGGGGLVGLGYHAGVMKALDEWGADVAAADVIVGTSAGSIIASYLGSGWQAADFYEYAHGRHEKSVKDPRDQKDEIDRIFTPLWNSRNERSEESRVGKECRS